MTPDLLLTRAAHDGNIPAIRAYLAIGATSAETRNRLLDDALLGYRNVLSYDSCAKCATVARMLVDAGATTKFPWIGPTARFLEDLRAAQSPVGSDA